MKRAYNELGSGAVEAMRENWPVAPKGHQKRERARPRNIKPMSSRASHMSSRQTAKARALQRPEQDEVTPSTAASASATRVVQRSKPSLSKEMVKAVQQVASPLVWAKAVPLQQPVVVS